MGERLAWKQAAHIGSTSRAGREWSHCIVRQRVALVSNTGWNILNFRMNLAQALIDRGFDVHAVGTADGSDSGIRAAGVTWHDWNLTRRSINPLSELDAMRSLDAVYRKIKPDLVHHFTVKPVLYGTTVARMRKIPAVVNSVTGLPYFLLSQPNSGIRSVARDAALKWYAWALSGNDVCPMFQNPDDLDVIASSNQQVRRQAISTRGSGVDLAKFRVITEESAAPEELVVTFVGRLIKEKGIFEFVEAARMVLSQTTRPVRFVVCGDVDIGNRSAVSPETMSEWKSVRGLEFPGHVDDMKRVLEQSHLVVLPSYREGTPRALLEAAACGLPIITTDVPGCREVVIDRENGLLVPAKDPVALAAAILELINDWSLIRKFGRAGRVRIHSLFDEQLVIDKTLDVYSRMLGEKRQAKAA
ncbi:MAG: glycosyltransferase family 4 protein [Rhodopirellula sp.]|nr:glycosyltransferase family 4 protein [Rhodopirellula sp.]